MPSHHPGPATRAAPARFSTGNMLARRCRAAALVAIACLAAAGGTTAAHAQGSLAAYASEDELVAALGRWRSLAEQAQQARRERTSPMMQSAPMPAATPAPAAPAAMAKAEAQAGASRDAASQESITNVQTAGVDEGGIVKRAGDYLVILRRGRLFTVRVGGDALRPVAMVDAYAPNADPRGAWYDELLVSGRTVVVVGYSYARGGTEIGLFDLGDDGSLAYRATWHLRSFDYYSARNYASRLIGRKLVFYSPTLLQPWGPAPMQLMPGVRRWQGPGTPPDWERILPATRIYRTDDDFDPAQPLALHTVTACDLGASAMRCESTAVLGPAGRVFCVSQGSVYVWTGRWNRGTDGRSSTQAAVFRIPLEGGAPSGLKAAGMPVDQMSFLEDRGHLNVLVRESGAGEGMWGGEAGQGRLALMRVPLSAFGDGRGSAQREHYRLMPGSGVGPLQNRYVGDWLLWGESPGWRRPQGGTRPGEQPSAWAVRHVDAGEPQALTAGHAVERIEALGAHALLVGNQGGDLHFTAVQLGSHQARLAGNHVQRGASQSESRTHGFFYRPQGDDEGLLGLPILGNAAGRRSGVYAGSGGAASVVFLRQRRLDFQLLGELVAQPGGSRNDGCRASCVDWYGNARPIFLGDRVFALMGYELVEGRLTGGGWRWADEERIEERRRVSFAPGGGTRDGRYSPFQ